MSSYTAANLSYGVLLSEESEEILLTAPKGETLKLISIGSEYGKDGIFHILGVNLSETCIEETTLRCVSPIQMIKDVELIKDKLHQNIKEMFGKYNIKDEIDLDFYFSIYQY